MKKNKFKIIDGGICAPKGFMAAGISCGIKKSNKKDLALIYSSKPAAAAGVFTTNKVKAAPVILSQKVIRSGAAQAIVINSGNANACAGPKGMQDAVAMSKHAADSLRLEEGSVLVASTGIIGVPLPMRKVASGIWTASRMVKTDGGKNAAEAILTTDLRKKEIAVEIPLGKKKIKIGGMAKGSGMICPNMATMIGVITTDAVIIPSLLRKALAEAVSCTFNMITVDNDMSTNDCVFCLANGASEKVSGATYGRFLEGLKYICEYLAKEIARDGEGATRMFSVKVRNAATLKDARLLAKTVAGSSLFKCAITGADPNIGRVLAAAGYSGAKMDPGKMDVYIEDVLLVRDGMAIEFDHAKAVHNMKKEEVVIIVDLKQGKSEATAWGCDMTEGYIKINARYHT